MVVFKTVPEVAEPEVAETDEHQTVLGLIKSVTEKHRAQNVHIGAGRPQGNEYNRGW